jgi:MFS family permease
VILMLPSLAQKGFGIDAGRAFLGNSIASFTLCLGCLFYGWLADRFGSAWVLLCGSLVLLLGSYLLFGDLARGGGHFLALYALAGFLVGVVGVVPVVMVELFPPAVRFSGISFAYNIAYAVFGASTTALIGALAAWGGRMAPAHYVAFTALVGAGAGLYLQRYARRASSLSVA